MKKQFALCLTVCIMAALLYTPSYADMSDTRQMGKQTENRYTVSKSGREQNVVNIVNKYQGNALHISSPGKQQVKEADLTYSQMVGRMGANYVQGAHSASQDGVVHLMQNYWLPNAASQITGTFQSFQGVSRSVDISFDTNLQSTFGVNSWARTNYYGYGTAGMDNHMVSVSIVVDLNQCLDTNAANSVSGTGKECKFDQIIAHEIMHAYMAETAPGFMLGASFREWFSEGAAEMANGGMYHMGDRTASQLCGNLSAGYVDYGGSYLAVAYAAWLSACSGYGGTCTVTADNLAYGLDRILAKLRETGNLSTALTATIGMDTKTFETKVSSGDGGKLQSFADHLRAASTNSEGVLGAGSVISGNLKTQSEFVVSNKPASQANMPISFTIIRVV